ncbi:hypothetical protein EXN66_Car009904 [Channa argus]|uniref:Uncharacterized protein n=1 Tax=Channa argus TaxID=215402 RepID=A0A6G1PW71_CHAAH|nr:hypothetical protein EXN66_Car009904 [Channa argus]
MLRDEGSLSDLRPSNLTVRKVLSPNTSLLLFTDKTNLLYAQYQALLTTGTIKSLSKGH